MTYSDKVKGISERLLVLDTLGDLGDTWRIEANGAVQIAGRDIVDGYVNYVEANVESFEEKCEWPDRVSFRETFESAEFPGGWEFFAHRIEPFAATGVPFLVQLQAIEDISDERCDLIGWAFMVEALNS